MKIPVFLVVAVVLLFAGVLPPGGAAFGAEAPRQDTSAVLSGPTPADAGSRDIEVGSVAPIFGAPDLTGRAFSMRMAIQDWKPERKCLVLVFFATWCQPCKQEIMKLSGARDRIAAAGADVLLIAAGEDARKVSGFTQRNPIPFRIVTDSYMQISRMYGITTPDMKVAVPRTFIIGSDGTVGRIFGNVGDTIVDDVLAACGGSGGQ